MVDDSSTVTGPISVAKRLHEILIGDLDRLETIDNYLRGVHPEPYMPDSADAEYRMLAKRSVTNHCPLLVDTPAQALYVDGFRRGNLQASASHSAGERRDLPEWQHFEESRLGSRQDAIIRGALGYGHSFVHTGKDERGRIVSKGLSPLRTVALYGDPVNDDNAIAVLHIKKPASRSVDGESVLDGRALLWDRTNEYPFKYSSAGEWRPDGEPVPHGLDGENPVTRFAAAVDLEGRTVGVVEPYLRIQDRINQTIFDLLVAQTAGSFKTRWATGMAPPVQMEPVYARDGNGDLLRAPDGELLIDEWRPKINPDTGSPIPAPIDLNAKRFLFGEDDDVRFGTLDETPLGPYVEAVDLAVRHLSALSQTPPHHLLGQIANLSAEALEAAETALSRKVDNFKMVFGEAWERVFRLAMLLSGDVASGEDMTGKVLWRDMESRSMSKTVDALIKLRELGIPVQGLWPRVPHTTQSELAEWEALFEEQGGIGMPLGASRDSVGAAFNARAEEDYGYEPAGSAAGF